MDRLLPVVLLLGVAAAIVGIDRWFMPGFAPYFICIGTITESPIACERHLK